MAHKTPLVGYGDGVFTVRAVKLYVDGALGSRGAALVEEYSDDPGNRGLTRISDEELESNIRLALQHGYQPCIHAIGDRGNHIVLNAYEKVLSTLPKGDYRPRIEHAQVILPDDIPRFQNIGVLPSMQPIHATSDMFWAEGRLGPQRVNGAYAWKSLLKTGTIIVGGSDFPNDGMYPLWGFYAAVTRSDRTGYPQDGWYRDQKMTREEAARCFTQWAAYGSFEENVKGTIEVGKLADLTVLSKDIMKVPAMEILSTEISMTIVGGKIVYQNAGSPLAQ
ncbi:MAG: amidohydrolase family protein, partial [Ignavibacteriales bacterium]|nr:amidohydrolase family protein [Ignavibacteriales bacterium]